MNDEAVERAYRQGWVDTGGEDMDLETFKRMVRQGHISLDLDEEEDEEDEKGDA